MIKLRVDDETAIPLSVDSSSAVSMTVSEAFIDRGGSAIQNNKNATPSTSQVVVTPDPGFDGMAKVTVAAIPEGDMDVEVYFDGRKATARATVSQDGYVESPAVFFGESNMSLASFTAPNITYDAGRLIVEDVIDHSGYISTEDSNTITAILSNYLPTVSAKTVTPTTSEQTAVDFNKWTMGKIKVGPIPPEYIVPSGTLAIATNGSHDVTNYATASVAVPASAVDTGTKNINANGTHDVVGYASAAVNVPNSYSASDEGKVVSNGALVAQTSDTVTTNDTYDTTLINSLTVNVSGGGGIGSVITVASDQTIGKTAIQDMFGGSSSFGKVVVGQLVNKAAADFDDYQICSFVSLLGGNNGGFLRWRTGSGLAYIAVGNTTAGHVITGDQYEVLSPKTYSL